MNGQPELLVAETQIADINCGYARIDNLELFAVFDGIVMQLLFFEKIRSGGLICHYV